jgi:hypothetical protein
LERLTQIEREHGLPGPAGQSHHVNADGTGSPMPAAVRAEVQALGPGFVDYMELQSRMRADTSRISVREVRAAVRATATFGMTRTWRALHLLDALLAA